MASSPLNSLVDYVFALNESHIVVIAIFLLYLVLVRCLRYRRAYQISNVFGPGKRPLSSMTTAEAFSITTQLQTLEFPYAFNKARTIALLKAGGIPTMSKLFAVTGQNNKKNAGKRAVDTEILLREAQTQPRESDRYMSAVARMNYLHTRYRKAGKILDLDLLHTLGDGAAEILHIVNAEEWRPLTDVEKCAVGIFHRNLGEDMDIPFLPLKSAETGWRDGKIFLEELVEWTLAYEKEVAKPTPTNDQYVRVYVDSATVRMPHSITLLLRRIIGAELDDIMRTSLGIEAPGQYLAVSLKIARASRRFMLRHLFLPRPSFLAYEPLSSDPDPTTNLYNFSHGGFQPWYIAPSFKTMWSPSALLIRALGGRKPGSNGDRYKPMGYDLKTIGPQPQEGKGFDDMRATVELLKSRGTTDCPFSSGPIKKREAYFKKEEV